MYWVMLMMMRPNLLNSRGSMKFPHNSFPWRLECSNSDTICHFQCEDHLRKHIDRYGLKAKDITVENCNGESFVLRKKHKRKV